jgi:hypothetical protein
MITKDINILKDALSLIALTIKKVLAGFKKQLDDTFKLTNKSLKGLRLTAKEVTLLVTKQPMTYLEQIFKPLESERTFISNNLSGPFEDRKLISLLRYALSDGSDSDSETGSCVALAVMMRVIEEKYLKTKSIKTRVKSSQEPEWEIVLSSDEIEEILVTQKFINDQLDCLNQVKT